MRAVDGGASRRREWRLQLSEHRQGHLVGARAYACPLLHVNGRMCDMTSITRAVNRLKSQRSPVKAQEPPTKNMDEVPLFVMLMLQSMPHKRLQRLCQIEGPFVQRGSRYLT
jgi:hypothetical protein